MAYYNDTEYSGTDWDAITARAARASAYIYEETGDGVDFVLDEDDDVQVTVDGIQRDTFSDMDDAIAWAMEQYGLEF